MRECNKKYTRLILLTAIAALIAQPAMSDIVRRSSIPEPLWGAWAVGSNDCNEKTGLVIAAQNTLTRERNARFARLAKRLVSVAHFTQREPSALRTLKL
jgi:hypothetical protein